MAMTLHGVAGYFDSVLYKDVTLSIVPATHTPGMFSWFPLFIPLCVPLQVKAGETITMNIWRYVCCRRFPLISYSVCAGVVMPAGCGTSGIHLNPV